MGLSMLDTSDVEDEADRAQRGWLRSGAV